MAWIYLAVAGLLECVWPLGLKHSEGFTRLGPSLLTVGTGGVSLYLLALAMKSIPVGTAYAVWTGIGATGVALLGMWLEGDPRTVGRLVCIGIIVSGILGLRILSGDA